MLKVSFGGVQPCAGKSGPNAVVYYESKPGRNGEDRSNPDRCAALSLISGNEKGEPSAEAEGRGLDATRATGSGDKVRAALPT